MNPENKCIAKCPNCGKEMELIKSESDKEAESMKKIDEANNFDELDKAIKE